MTGNRLEHQGIVDHSAGHRAYVSREGLRATTPKRLTRPNVGLSPTTLLSAAGSRIDPPVSVPIAAKAERAATAAPEPALEPPG